MTSPHLSRSSSSWKSPRHVATSSHRWSAIMTRSSRLLRTCTTGPVVPVQIEKIRIFRTPFWVSLREITRLREALHRAIMCSLLECTSGYTNTSRAYCCMQCNTVAAARLKLAICCVGSLLPDWNTTSTLPVPETAHVHSACRTCGARSYTGETPTLP